MLPTLGGRIGIARATSPSCSELWCWRDMLLPLPSSFIIAFLLFAPSTSSLLRALAFTGGTSCHTGWNGLWTRSSSLARPRCSSCLRPKDSSGLARSTGRSGKTGDTEGPMLTLMEILFLMFILGLLLAFGMFLVEKLAE